MVCVRWHSADVDLFVINGDLTTYKTTIKEREMEPASR